MKAEFICRNCHEQLTAGIDVVDGVLWIKILPCRKCIEHSVSRDRSVIMEKTRMNAEVHNIAIKIKIMYEVKP